MRDYPILHLKYKLKWRNSTFITVLTVKTCNDIPGIVQFAEYNEG